MAKLEFRLEFVSPAFLYGAYQRNPAVPEIRAPSIRGQLRYWLRAIAGARTQDLRQIWDTESAVFGSTGAGSPISVRVFTGRIATDSVPLMPHRDSKQGPQTAIREGQRAVLELVTRPGASFPPDALHALKIWSLLGGIGKRSRRMFGAVQLTPSGDVAGWYAPPASPDALVDTIRQYLQAAVGVSIASLNSIPRFPTVHPDHSWVVVGRDGSDDPVEMNRMLFRDILRTQRYRQHEDTFGFARGGRRASPLIAQVYLIDGTYYPVLTALRSEPSRRIEWNVLHDFMQDAEHYYNGVTAWGGW